MLCLARGSPCSALQVAERCRCEEEDGLEWQELRAWAIIIIIIKLTHTRRRRSGGGGGAREVRLTSPGSGVRRVEKGKDRGGITCLGGPLDPKLDGDPLDP
jgi:hypothetical protein